MNKFVQKTLKKLLHERPTRQQHAPNKWSIPTCGEIRQLETPSDTNQQLIKQDMNYIQRVVRSFLYYTRLIENVAITA